MGLSFPVWSAEKENTKMYVKKYSQKTVKQVSFPVSTDWRNEFLLNDQVQRLSGHCHS